MITYKIGTIPFDGTVTPIVHCIAQDRGLGAGIAASVPEFHKALIRSQPRVEIGDLHCSVDQNGLMIVHLVTKKYSGDKPTREDFQTTLEMFGYCVSQAGVTNFHCPMMGAGIDRLPWEFVESVLIKSPIHFTVWVLPEHPQAEVVRALSTRDTERKPLSS